MQNNHCNPFKQLGTVDNNTLVDMVFFSLILAATLLQFYCNGEIEHTWQGVSFHEKDFLINAARRINLFRHQLIHYSFNQPYLKENSALHRT